MGLSTKANGTTTRHKVEVNSLMLMVIFMMVTGKRIKHRDMELIFIIMGRGIKGNGSMTINMDRDWRLGSMAVAIRAPINKARKTVKASIRGRTAASTMALGSTTR
jgi:hypothetical protein